MPYSFGASALHIWPYKATKNSPNLGEFSETFADILVNAEEAEHNSRKTPG